MGFFFPGCRWPEDGFGDYLSSLRPKEKGGKRTAGRLEGEKRLAFIWTSLILPLLPTFPANIWPAEAYV